MNDLEQFTDEELEQELEQRKFKNPPKITMLKDWQIQKNFEQLKKKVSDYVDSVHKREDRDDDEHYMWEHLMETFYGKGYWDWHNSIKC